MITGDHIETAKKVALDSGLVSKEEIQARGCVVSGEEFRTMVGHYEIHYNPDTKKNDIIFQNPERFKDIKKRVRIIARACPDDKLILIKGL